MSEDTTLAADLSAALSDTSAQDSGAVSTAPVEDSAQPGAATIQPAETTAVSPSTDPAPKKPAGPIPFEAHSTALENARAKTRAEVEAEWQDVAWAKQVDREAVARAVEMGQRLQQDRAGFIRQLLSEADNDPVLSAELRSEAGRMLAKGRGQAAAPPPVDLTPIQIDLGNGQGVPFYTAEQHQALLSQGIAQELAKLRQEFAPALGVAQELQAQKDEDAAAKWSGGFFSEVSKYPHFAEHKSEIHADVQRQIAAYPKDDPRSGSREFLEAAVLRSYNRIVTPKLHLSAQRAVLTEQNAQAAATTVNPSRLGTAAPKSFDDMSLAEALAANVSV